MKKPAHATFKGDAICGALLTGKSPEGRPFCDACLGIMFDWLAAHDIDTAHAVANEQAAIVAHLNAKSVEHWDVALDVPDGTNARHALELIAATYTNAAHAIESGAHNQAKEQA